MRLLARALNFVSAMLVVQGCSDPAATVTHPTAPTPTQSGVRVQVTCAASTLLIGQRTICTSSFGTDLRSWTDTTWSVNPPGLVTVETLGGVVVAGQTSGSGTLTATYSGQTVMVPIAVRAEDGLVLAAPISQSSGTAGSSAMLGLTGYYAVTSADRGTLTVSVRDAAGRAFASAGQPVSKGGGAFSMSVSFTLPSDTPQVCAYVTLIAGSTRIEAPTDWPDALHCLQVR